MDFFTVLADFTAKALGAYTADALCREMSAKRKNEGIHRLARPVGQIYKSADEQRRDPAGVLAGLVSEGYAADAGQRWKHGREIVGCAGFVAWAGEHGFVIDAGAFGIPAHAAAGGEHIVFADAQLLRVVKLTKPGLFGAQAADAGAYMQRMALGNRIFGDDMRLEGIVLLPGEQEPRTVMSQAFAEGRDATTEEQLDYLRGRGFVEYHGKFVHPVTGITVWDSFTAGNMIARRDGSFQAIDLQVEPSNPEELNEVRNGSGIGGELFFSKRRTGSSFGA